MADLFISYASEDRERVIPVVRALESRGWSVWWDRIIPPGKTFTKVIEEALGEARCLIVLWTEASVKSDWVSNEAAEGVRRGILIPALMDAVEIPFEFRRIQAADISDWRGENDHAGFRELVKALNALLGPPGKSEVGPAALRTSRFPEGSSDADADDAVPSGPDVPASPAGRRTALRRRAWARIGAGAAFALLAAAGALWLVRPEPEKPRGGPPAVVVDKPRPESAAPATEAQTPVKTPATAAPPADESSGPAPKAGASMSTEHAEAPAAVAAGPPVTAAPAEPIAAAFVDAPKTPEPAPPKPAEPSAKTSPPAVPAPEVRDRPETREPVKKRERAARPATPDAQIKAEPKPRPAPVEPAAETRPKEAPLQRRMTNAAGMVFLRIEPAAEPFTMGSRRAPADLAKRFGGGEAFYRTEGPSRTVRIAQTFYLQATPVTQGQWRRVMGENPSSFKDCGEDCPVEMVSWEEAQRFIERLNRMEGAGSYRLPSEAEWEYAVRAGGETEFFFGDDPAALGDYAWYAANSGNRPHPVGRKKPNPWGFHDMAGNVWAWMADDWHASYAGAPGDGRAWVDAARGAARVVRGGAWGVMARYCRSAARYYGNADARNSHTGLRLAYSK